MYERETPLVSVLLEELDQEFAAAGEAGLVYHVFDSLFSVTKLLYSYLLSFVEALGTLQKVMKQKCYCNSSCVSFMGTKPHRKQGKFDLDFRNRGT